MINARLVTDLLASVRALRQGGCASLADALLVEVRGLVERGQSVQGAAIRYVGIVVQPTGRAAIEDAKSQLYAVSPSEMGQVAALARGTVVSFHKRQCQCGGSTATAVRAYGGDATARHGVA